MIQSVIEQELSNEWASTEYLDSVEDSEKLDDTTVKPVAVHNDGAELYVQKIDEWWMASLSQTVVLDALAVDVVTDSETFTEDQELAYFINHVCDRIDSGGGVINGLAVVPHNGDLDSINVDSIDTNNWSEETQFADVFAIFPAQLPDRVSVDDVVAEKQDIAELIYGLNDEIPDTVQELNNPNESAGQATIQVFTVTGEDITLAE